MFGYPTQQPCAVCGKINGNELEPRYGYAVCLDHMNTVPAEIGR